MDKVDFKAFRVDELGMTQDQTAQAFGVTKRTVQGWEYGEVAIPGPVLLLMRLIRDPRLKVLTYVRKLAPRRNKPGPKPKPKE